MNKVKKIVFIMINIILMFSIECFAKYNYNFTLNAYKLSRDSSEITYVISRTESDREYTNQDVVLTIDFNKPVYPIDGFTISEDRKQLTKKISENEKSTITVEDISGNKKDVPYEINNIDKIPPEIIGVENGKTYTSNVSLDYKDNIGIKDIVVDKYSDLKLSLYDDYYDTGSYKGTDLTDTTANIRVISHPKNTKTYKYYINNSFKAESTNTQYNFTGLKKGTSYTIKVEAVDENGIVLQTATRNIKTKLFSKITGTKNSSGTFAVTVSGIDSNIDSAIAVAFTNSSGKNMTYPKIKSDNSISVTFATNAVTENIEEGYYYFHLQFFDNGNHVETACCNIIFKTSDTSNSSGNTLYNLTTNGNYHIIVTDLAGNKTEKYIIIKK